MIQTDNARRFIFDDADVRGNFVRLQESYQNITNPHQYPAAVQTLLGEFLVAALLLSDTIKFEGRLTLQAKSSGPIKLLMAEATHNGDTRGIVQMAEGSPRADDVEFKSLFQNGILAVTVEPLVGQRYQSIVPLVGDDLASCLDHYFQQSEQLGTLIQLAVDETRAAGMLIQQLPKQVEPDTRKREDHWALISVLGNTLTPEELLGQPNDVILRRLFNEQNIRLLTEKPVRFFCSCSEERMGRALISLGAEELGQLFAEQDELELVCEFFARKYQFDATTLTRMLTGDEPAH